MNFRSLMTAICVLATANVVSAAPFAYVANSGTKNVSIIDTADDTIKATVALPDTQPTVHPYAWGVAVGSSGQYAYVGLQTTNEVAVIDSARNLVVKRIGLGADSPGGLAVNDAETRLYVASNMSNTLIVIDISATGATEVGRVTIDDSPVSNPTGVVLNSTGDKAYVANAATGNIAEVSLDEANNVYTRLSTIPLGSVQPYGLTLNPAGTMLYAASLQGDTRAIKLSDQTITTLRTDTGNLALAVKSDGSKVYAPSNSIDKLFVVDSSVTPNVVLGTNYDVAAGPYGISITPGDSKLYITMNTASAGETVKVFDTVSNTVTNTINLPAGAKPTSFGNFIGPLLPFTIAASDDNTNCVISPEGTIPVNNKGRVFNIAAISGTCKITVDGQPAGQPSAYNFTNVTDSSHTINASPADPGTYYTLTTDWSPATEGRCLQSDVAGISCYSKSAQYLAGMVVKISATPGFSASGWTGACLGTSGGTCTLTMDADKSATAIINLGGGGPVKNITKGTFHQTIDDAITNAATNDEIRVIKEYVGTSVSTTTPAAATMVTVSGGWNTDFSARAVTTDSSDAGNIVTIAGPGITVDQLVI